MENKKIATEENAQALKPQAKERAAATGEEAAASHQPEGEVYDEFEDEVDLLIHQIVKRQHQLREKLRLDVALKDKTDKTIKALENKLHDVQNRVAKRIIARDTYSEVTALTETAFDAVITTADEVANMLNKDLTMGDDVTGTNPEYEHPKIAASGEEADEAAAESDDGGKKKKKKSKKSKKEGAASAEEDEAAPAAASESEGEEKKKKKKSKKEKKSKE